MGAITTFTGILSGRIRTDADSLTTMYNMMGMDGPQDYIDDNIRRCGTVEDCA
jgi:hypothetical protein